MQNYYIVKRMKGDYIDLLCETDGEILTVATALLPNNITEGSRLKYDSFNFETAEDFSDV